MDEEDKLTEAEYSGHAEYTTRDYFLDLVEDAAKALFLIVAGAFCGFALYLWAPVITAGIQAIR